MKIGFNVVIETSNSIDEMNFDEAQEYKCRICDLISYFSTELTYIDAHIDSLLQDEL